MSSAFDIDAAKAAKMSDDFLGLAILITAEAQKGKYFLFYEYIQGRTLSAGQINSLRDRGFYVRDSGIFEFNEAVYGGYRLHKHYGTFIYWGWLSREALNSLSDKEIGGFIDTSNGFANFSNESKIELPV